MIGVGDKVVCIRNFSSFSRHGRVTGDIPQKGEIYTIISAKPL